MNVCGDHPCLLLIVYYINHTYHDGKSALLSVTINYAVVTYFGLIDLTYKDRVVII